MANSWRFNDAPTRQPRGTGGTGQATRGVARSTAHAVTYEFRNVRIRDHDLVVMGERLPAVVKVPIKMGETRRVHRDVQHVPSIIRFPCDYCGRLFTTTPALCERVRVDEDNIAFIPIERVCHRLACVRKHARKMAAPKVRTTAKTEAGQLRAAARAIADKIYPRK